MNLYKANSHFNKWRVRIEMLTVWFSSGSALKQDIRLLELPNLRLAASPSGSKVPGHFPVF